MRPIDLETWPRRDHFRLFYSYTYPHFGVCANVDLTVFHQAVKEYGASMTVAIVYALARAANAVPEFRLRILDGKVVEHRIVHPATTVLTSDDIFSFVIFDYLDEFATFAAVAEERIAQVKQNLLMERAPDQALLFMTSIPWLIFTGFVHPLDLGPQDSVPRFAWGKFFWEGERLKMPLNVQAHHALMDGLHVGRFYEHVKADLDEPERVLGPVA